MRKKANKAFFEAFRRSETSAKGRAWWMPNESVGATKGKAALSSGRSGSRKHDVTAPPGRVALTFSREALVVMIVVAATLLVIAHVWGYKRGLARPGVGARRVAEDGPSGRTTESVAARGTPTGTSSSPGSDSRLLNVGASPAIKPPFHTIRIYSMIPRNSALKIRDELLAKGYDAFVYKEPRQRDYTLNVGRFKSRSELQDSRLLLKLAPVYEKCYILEVLSEEQIIQ